MRSLLYVFMFISFWGCIKDKNVPLENLELSYPFNNNSAQYHGVLDMSSVFIAGKITNANEDILWLETNLLGEKTNETSIDLGADEFGEFVIKTSTQQFVVLANQIDAKKLNHAYFLLLDKNGNIIYNKKFKGNPRIKIIHGIEYEPGIFYLAGEITKTEGNAKKIWIAYINVLTDSVTEKTIGYYLNNNSLAEGATNLVKGNNKNIYLLGYAQPMLNEDRDFTFFEFSQDLSVLKSKPIILPGYQEGQKMLELPNGNFAIAGHTSETDPHHNIALLEINASGEVISKNEFGQMHHEGAEDLILTQFGSLLITARTNSFGENNQKGMLLKTDLLGNQINQIVFNKFHDFYPNNILESATDFYIIGKSKTSENATQDLCIVVCNKNLTE